MNNISFYFVNGKPNSGKDSQAERLQRVLPRSIILSTGDMVRGASKQEGPYAKFHHIIEPHIKTSQEGGLIPDQVILEMVGEVVMGKDGNEFKNVIFTGFPRTVPQLQAVYQWMDRVKNGGMDSRATYIDLRVSDEEARKRALLRAREDDDMQVLENRFGFFDEQTKPMLDMLEVAEELVIVNGEQTREEVFEELLEKLELKKALVEGASNPQERK